MMTRGRDSVGLIGHARSGRGIWIDEGTLRRHMLVAGTTGSGKSEFLLSLLAGCLSTGSGAIFVDGKGDASTYARVHAIASLLGRQDDVLCANFSGRDLGIRNSHTLDPFRSLDAASITSFVVGMMGGTETTRGDNAMWHGRAVALVTAVITGLVWRRDNHGALLTPGILRNALGLKEVVDLRDRLQGEGGPVDGLNGYLASLPGYQEDKEKQAQTTIEQHGYLSMQTTRPVGLLADAFGHVTSTARSEIGIEDVVANDRILVVLLPTLTRSSAETSQIGKLVVGLLRNLMARSLSSRIEGGSPLEYDGRAGHPYPVVFDEVSHYLSEGMGLMAAQARSLGYGFVFATQSIEAMSNADRAETELVTANTGTKIILRQASASRFSAVEGILPSNDRQNSARTERSHDDIERMELLRHRLNHGHGLHRESAAAEIEVMLERAVERAAADPYWRLDGTIKDLRPGEFGAVSGDDFIVGRSLHASASARPDSRPVLSQTVSLPDAATLRARAERERRIAVTRSALREGDPSWTDKAGLGGCPFARIVPEDRKQFGQEARHVAQAILSIFAYRRDLTDGDAASKRDDQPVFRMDCAT